MPPAFEPQSFTDAKAAVAAVKALYERNTEFLRGRFEAVTRGELQANRVRATYPQIEFAVELRPHRFAPGLWPCRRRRAIYRPQSRSPTLFGNYLTEQIRLLLRNHGVPVTVGRRTCRSRCISPFPKASMSRGAAAGLSVRCATSSTCRTSRRPMTPSSTATYEPPPGAAAAARAVHRAARRLFAVPPAALHRHRRRSISRTSSCSPTTSSISTSSASAPAS